MQEKHYKILYSSAYILTMNTDHRQLPANWIKLNNPNYYHYKDILVKRTDYNDGKIELTARDFTGKLCRIEARQLWDAFKRMEDKLKCNQ